MSSFCWAEKQPNFLFIVADDLGYGDVGYQGGSQPTPNIDAIAKNGVVFTDGYVTAPVCAPSRAGFLTGRYQQSFGFWDNTGPYQVKKDIVQGIPRDLPLISERLKKLGYVTGLFGKTHDGTAEEIMAFNRWDEFYGFNNGASNFLGGMNKKHNPIFHNKKIVSQPYVERGIKLGKVHKKGVLLRDREEYLTDKLGEMAVKFIEKNKDNPFLCFIPFNAIHGPFQAPKELVDQYAHIKDHKRRLNCAMLQSMDDNIGRVLGCLKKNDLMKDTLIIFISDNGGHEASPSLPLKGKKNTYWEGGLRVPFCVRWDGVIPVGQTLKHPVMSLDVMPTMIKAAGGEIDPSWNLDGVDILPYMTGLNTHRPHETLYWVWQGGVKKAIREGDFKAVTMNKGKHYFLYDLSKDISEKRDLSKMFPEKLQNMVAKHKKWEDTLMRPQWGWNKKMGHKAENFGKLEPYHDSKYMIK
jgi:arylsulfatase A-like enzyme